MGFLFCADPRSMLIMNIIVSWRTEISHVPVMLDRESAEIGREASFGTDAGIYRHALCRVRGRIELKYNTVKITKKIRSCFLYL
jgi:hypothetical protein